MKVKSDTIIRNRRDAVEYLFKSGVATPESFSEMVDLVCQGFDGLIAKQIDDMYLYRCEKCQQVGSVNDFDSIGLGDEALACLECGHINSGDAPESVFMS